MDNTVKLWILCVILIQELKAYDFFLFLKRKKKWVDFCKKAVQSSSSMFEVGSFSHLFGLFLLFKVPPVRNKIVLIKLVHFVPYIRIILLI